MSTWVKDKGMSNYEWQDNFVMTRGLFDIYLFNKIFNIRMNFYAFVQWFPWCSILEIQQIMSQT